MMNFVSAGLRRQIVRLCWFMLLPLVSVGCALVGPDYQAVKPRASHQWNTDLAAGLTADSPAAEELSLWWRVFADQELESLILRVVDGNLDLRQARSRILEARALRGLEQADPYPTAAVGAAVTRSRSSADSSSGQVKVLYSTGFDSSWELDLFGGRRRAVEAAQAGLEATQENLNDLLVSLQAETALNYADLRISQSRLLLTRAAVEKLAQIHQLNRSRHQAGIGNALAVQESQRQLETARATMPALQTSVAGAKNRLTILLGLQPGELDQELEAYSSLPSLPRQIAVGIPAETLRRRPDVRRSERLLAQQTARVGVAEADLYPKLRLAGSLGLESLSFGELFQGGSRKWSLGPGVSWNIFDAGAVRRNIEIQSERQQQALLEYEKTVLTALHDVENALIAFAGEQQRDEALTQALQAAERAEDLALDQYQAGLISYYAVLDAQRSRLALEDESVRCKGALFSDLVRLYKALAGGWQAFAPPSAADAE